MNQPNTSDEHPLMQPGHNRLAGQVAIVTGAANGIGRATARLFAREGAKVVCVDLREDGTQPRVDELIRQDGGTAHFMLGDVADSSACLRMVTTALDQFGGLDILFNNAGVGVRKKLHEFTDEEWNFVIDVNLRGVFNGVRAAMPYFLAQEHGVIVNTASSLGVLASAEYPAYCATKAAIINLTRQLALDYGPAVRVNCVCPGPIATPRYRGYPPVARYPQGMTDAEMAGQGGSVRALHRVGRPEEVAAAVLFLACAESSFVTGHALVVDGGQTIDA